jgi:hypothetical protein
MKRKTTLGRVLPVVKAKAISKRLTYNHNGYLEHVLLPEFSPEDIYLGLYNILALANTSPPKDWVTMKAENPIHYYREIMPFLDRVAALAKARAPKRPMTRSLLKVGTEALTVQCIYLSIARIGMVFRLMNDPLGQAQVMLDATLLRQVLKDMLEHFFQEDMYHQHSVSDCLCTIEFITNAMNISDVFDDENLNLLLDIFERWINFSMPEMQVSDDHKMLSYLKCVVDYCEQKNQGVLERALAIKKTYADERSYEAAGALMNLFMADPASLSPVLIETLPSTASFDSPSKRVKVSSVLNANTFFYRQDVNGEVYYVSPAVESNVILLRK